MYVRILALIIIALIGLSTNTQAQALKITAGNTLIGTANGAVLGLSVMGITNDSDITPVRFGVGAGTIFGLGVGIYDVSRLDGLGMYYVDGLFNSAEYSTLIVLLDTAYGTVTGTVLGMAFALMANENILLYMQYGASAGAMAGFAFGLVDAFYLSTRPSFSLSNNSTPAINRVNGVIALNYHSSSGSKVDIGILHPTVQLVPSHMNSGTHLKYEPTLQVMNLRVSF